MAHNTSIFLNIQAVSLLTGESELPLNFHRASDQSLTFSVPSQLKAQRPLSGFGQLWVTPSDLKCMHDNSVVVTEHGRADSAVGIERTPQQHRHDDPSLRAQRNLHTHK